MAEFATKGVAGSGLGLGIAGTALGLLNGGLNNLFGNPYQYPYCSENTPVTRYEQEQQQKIASLESQIALRDANIYNDQKMLELYKYFDGEIKNIRETSCEKWAAQGVINANLNSATAVLTSQLADTNATLAMITRTAVPTSALCSFCSPCNQCNNVNV